MPGDGRSRRTLAPAAGTGKPTSPAPASTTRRSRGPTVLVARTATVRNAGGARRIRWVSPSLIVGASRVVSQSAPMADAQGATSERRAGIPEALRAVTEGMRSNPHLLDVSTTPLLTPDECTDVLAGLDADGWDEMTVMVGGDGPGAPHRPTKVPEVRRGRLRPVPGGASGALATRIGARVLEINADVYRFRVVGVEDEMRVLWYGSEDRDGYSAHVDVGPASPLRKLSFSLLLSDPASYTGGDVCFRAPFALARQQGTLTVFPSFLQHAVAPVTEGDRYAVVGWVLGPTFS